MPGVGVDLSPGAIEFLATQISIDAFLDQIYLPGSYTETVSIPFPPSSAKPELIDSLRAVFAAVPHEQNRVTPFEVGISMPKVLFVGGSKSEAPYAIEAEIADDLVELTVTVRAVSGNVEQAKATAKAIVGEIREKLSESGRSPGSP
ncbi:MAG TPA: hypothetical protein VGN57_08780 [Pirellulaceae bacterium]|nr:hypothetical protein [Pirellulaceae bacterium]